MNYSAESLYDVMSNALKEEMSKNPIWNNINERIGMVISYAIDDKHMELYYDEKEEMMCYRYLTPFGGLMLDISGIITLDYNIKVEDDENYWTFFENIASLFLEENMEEADKFFYNEIKSGNLKMDWRLLPGIGITEKEQKLIEDMLREFFDRK